MTQRYDIESIEGSYYIFDTHNKSPTTHLLWTVPVTHGAYNWQILLAQYDAKKNFRQDYHTIDREVFSTRIFASTTDILDHTIQNALSLIQMIEITNPVELVLEFGGLVLGEPVPIPRLPVSH